MGSGSLDAFVAWLRARGKSPVTAESYRLLVYRTLCSESVKVELSSEAVAAFVRTLPTTRLGAWSSAWNAFREFCLASGGNPILPPSKEILHLLAGPASSLPAFPVPIAPKREALFRFLQAVVRYGPELPESKKLIPYLLATRWGAPVRSIGQETAINAPDGVYTFTMDTQIYKNYAAWAWDEGKIGFDPTLPLVLVAPGSRVEMTSWDFVKFFRDLSRE